MTITTTFFTQTQAVGQLAGAWGEDFTREELGRVQRGRLIWGSVHGLETESGDVDHVAVTCGGLMIAIDSTWRNDPDQATLERAAQAAATSARRARLMLRSVHKTALDVVPVDCASGFDRTRGGDR